MIERSEITQKKPRVLISGHLPPPLGGMATYYQSLINSSLNEEVDYLFVQTSSQNRLGANTGLLSISNIISAIKDCFRFTRSMITFKPQIAHIGTAYGLSFLKHSYCIFIAWLMKSRVLLHPHCSLKVLYFDRSGIWKWYFRKVINFTYGTVALSKEWLQLRSINSKMRIFVLPNAVDLRLYQPALEKHLTSLESNDALNVLYLGYLGKEKGSFDILDAAIQIDSSKNKIFFDLVGSEATPGELDLLKEKIKSENLEKTIRIYKPVIGKEKINFFMNADIFIYPSYFEGMPMAVLEAMASGLPIIASRVGGLPDIVTDNQNGFLIEPGHPEQLADAILKIANDLEMRQSMQLNSYKNASKNFSLEQHISQLIEIYRSLLVTSPI